MPVDFRQLDKLWRGGNKDLKSICFRIASGKSRTTKRTLHDSVQEFVFIEKSGEPCRIRTCDPLIKSQLLYQLS